MVNRSRVRHSVIQCMQLPHYFICTPNALRHSLRFTVPSQRTIKMPTHYSFVETFLGFLIRPFTLIPAMNPPLEDLRAWAPFRLDALGLLTMLGTNEMSREIGSLSANTLVSWLSLLGGNVVPSNAFVQPLHGYTLYNISDAIQSTTLAGWFSRWLVTQNPSQNTSLFVWSVRCHPRRRGHRALAIGIIINTCILVLPLLIKDYYGLASALCMGVGIAVRAYLVTQNSNAVDRAAVDTSIHSNELVKTFVILANGKATTVMAPRNVVVNCFMSTPKVVHPKYYDIARAIGWLAFVGLVVTIGQAVLVVQIVIIIVTVSATFMTAFGIGTVHDGVGKSLHVVRFEHPSRHGRRGEAYAMLHLSKEEEQTMIDWALFPQRRNQTWWSQYRSYTAAESKVFDVSEDGSKEKNLLNVSSVGSSTSIQ